MSRPVIKVSLAKSYFFIVSGVNTVSKYLGSVDPVYASLFLHDSWRELLEKAEPGKSDVSEIVSRISKYLECSTDSLVHLPVAEAMVTYKEKRNEETSQGRTDFSSNRRSCASYEYDIKDKTHLLIPSESYFDGFSQRFF